MMASRRPLSLRWPLAFAIESLTADPDHRVATTAGGDELSWVILEPRDPQAKGILERSHRFMRSNFEPGRVFANHLDFQDRLDTFSRTTEPPWRPNDAQP